MIPVGVDGSRGLLQILSSRGRFQYRGGRVLHSRRDECLQHGSVPDEWRQDSRRDLLEPVSAILESQSDITAIAANRKFCGRSEVKSDLSLLNMPING